MAGAAAIAALLGGATVLGRDVHTDLELTAEIERGLPSASLARLVEELRTGLSPEPIYSVVRCEGDLERREQDRERLTSGESERLVRLARLVIRAEEALGERNTASRWMGKPNRALEGRRPLEWLATDADATRVEDVLGRIEHGVYG